MSFAGIRFIRKDGRIIPIRDGSAPSGTDAGQKPPHPAVRKLQAARANLHVKKEEFKIKVNAGLEKIGSQTRLPTEPITPRKDLNALGLGLAVAGGAISALTFTGSAKKIIIGQTVGQLFDIGSSIANVGSVAGADRRKERLKLGAKQELRNTIIGHAVFGAGLVGLKKNRAATVSGIRTVGTFAKKWMKLS